MRWYSGELRNKGCRSLVMLLSLTFSPALVTGQSAASASGGPSGGTSVQAMPAPVNSSTYQGSLVKQPVVPGVRPLSLDEAIRMGLQYNLGLVLSGVNASTAGGQRLEDLLDMLAN